MRTLDGPLIVVAESSPRSWLEGDRDANPRSPALLGLLQGYVICYVSLVGLYIVIDAFSNLDEFSKRADSRGRDLPDHGPVLPGAPEPVLRPALRRDRHDGGDLHRHLDAAEQRAARDAGGGHQHASGDRAGAGVVGDRQLFAVVQPGGRDSLFRRGAGAAPRRRRPCSGSTWSPPATTRGAS